MGVLARAGAWMRGDDLLPVQLSNGNGLSPLAVRFSSEARSWLLRGGSDAAVGPVTSLDDLPILFGARRFIADKIVGMPRRLINAQSGQVRAVNPPWLDGMANPVETFSNLLDVMVGELLWCGEVFLMPVARRGMLAEVYAYSSRYVTQTDWVHRTGYPAGRPMWQVNGVYEPRLVQVKMGARANHLRGRGIRDSGQQLLQAYAAALEYSQRLYRGTLTKMLTGDFSHMNDTEQEEFKTEFEARTRGDENVGEVLFVPTEKVKVETLSWDAVQTAHVELMADLARQIVNQLFSIPAQMFTLNESGTQVTYTTVPALAERLYQDALHPVVKAIEDGFSRIMSRWRLDLDERRLLSGTVSDQTARARVMAEINGMGEPLFLPQEVREVAGFEGWPEELSAMMEEKQAAEERQKEREAEAMAQAQAAPEDQEEDEAPEEEEE